MLKDRLCKSLLDRISGKKDEPVKDEIKPKIVKKGKKSKIRTKGSIIKGDK
jgi:hypothetical protein